MKYFDRKFFNQSTLEVAKKLLGKFLVHNQKTEKLVGKIVETEAYSGINDLASHASKGRTPRTEIMFGPAGYSYIYMIYGIYYCFNIVTENKNYPAAVLIRALEPVNPPINEYAKTTGRNDPKPASGPGKLCRYMKIDKKLNSIDLTKNILWLEDRGLLLNQNNIVSSKRIGIEYAKHCKNYKWRFFIKNNIYVSKL